MLIFAEILDASTMTTTCLDLHYLALPSQIHPEPSTSFSKTDLPIEVKNHELLYKIQQKVRWLQHCS